MVSDARRMLNSMEMINISLPHRDGNCCADWMTKWCRDRGSVTVILDEFLLELRRLAEEDKKMLQASCRSCVSPG